MSRWGREFRFLTVSALVVLSLTGFSTGSHSSSGGSSGGGKVSKSKSGSGRSGKSRSSRHSSGGGGCSSSHQDHDAYDDDDDTSGDDTYADTTDATEVTAIPQQGAKVRLLSCATRKQPYATVELRNPNAQDGTFELRISFLDARGKLVDFELDHVEVPGNGTVTTKEYVVGNVSAVRRCQVSELADPVTSTP
ncbi:hypothetical protein AB0E88_12195 [Streptomyces sp. NPDC028635]|uniref:hypothetical protein n=1 Tax=Streptomyces sp. NPDC028635 TaxID=3154800 RepID=UPI0033BFCF5C